MAIDRLLLKADLQFTEIPPSGLGTEEPSEGLRAERQQTEWTGHWLCICQQSGISLNPPPAAKRVRHHGHSQLSAGLLPFRFPGRPAAGCPMLTFALSLVEWQVTKYSGRSRRLLNDKSSAKADLGPLTEIRRQCACSLPLSYWR